MLQCRRWRMWNSLMLRFSLHKGKSRVESWQRIDNDQKPMDPDGNDEFDED